MDVWLTRFLNSATDGFLMLDEDLRVINANESWLQQAGLTQGVIIGRYISDIFPDMKEAKLELYRQVMVTGDPVEFKHEDSMRLNGRVFDVQVFKAEEGVGVITREITEQVKYKRGLEALHIHTAKIAEAKELEEVYRLTYSLLQDALGFPVIDLIKIEEGYLMDVFSYGSELMQIPIDGPGITARAARTGKTQFVNDIREDGDYIRGPMMYNSLSEITVPVKIDDDPRLLINVESPELNAFTENDRKLIEILARHLSSDIKRITYEKTLKALEKYSKLLHKASTLDEAVHTTLGFITDVMGFSRAGIGIVEGDKIKPLQYVEPVQVGTLSIDQPSVIARAVRTGKSQLVPDTREDEDYIPYSRRDCSVSLSELAVPIIDGKKVIGVINIESQKFDDYDKKDQKLMEIFSDNVALAIRRLRKMNDLENRVVERTEELQRAYQELKYANKLKDQVMGMATHELRTPLTSIKGYVDYIRSGAAGKVPKEIDNLLEIVERNSKRLQKLTDDMLDQQRLETGTLEMEMEYTDIVELIKEAKEEITPVLRERGQKLYLDIENIPLCKLEPTRISQVLINLLNNASKYSPKETEIKLKVEENSDKVIIKVIDEGIGLCDEDLERLFKPFPRIEKPVEYTNGIGLGLSISRGFVELHGGEMWAESQGEGKGSTFIFTIPVS